MIPEMRRRPKDRKDDDGDRARISACAAGHSTGSSRPSLTLNDTLVSVVGVAPPRFRFPSAEVDVWIPRATAARTPGDTTSSHSVSLAMRLLGIDG